jgi:hypothetical protein
MCCHHTVGADEPTIWGNKCTDFSAEPSKSSIILIKHTLYQALFHLGDDILID